MDGWMDFFTDILPLSIYSGGKQNRKPSPRIRFFSWTSMHLVIQQQGRDTEHNSGVFAVNRLCNYCTTMAMNSMLILKNVPEHKKS
jgi:hypothetical protein